MVYGFTRVKQITSGPSPVDAAGEKLDLLLRSFPVFWTSHLAGEDNHRGRNFNVFRPPVNLCVLLAVLVCCSLTVNVCSCTSGSTP
jgi:hypothetical protein